ncbi:unnamed protein product [Lactuca virosa]|uniref:Uncharacterized protein n=1 Tax=Lactuca virosa TaxID=75947 RepID=A0AAU9M3B8_9ASTR|nr:unnamed protein product [Lactuca virosa]
MTLTSNVEVEVYMEDLNETDDESDGEEYVASTMDKTIWDPFLNDLEGHNARTCKNEKVIPPPKEKKPPGRPKKPHSDETPSKRPTTSGGRRGRGGRRGPTRARGGRGSSVGTSGGRGGRSLIDEIFDSPTENEFINMFDNFEEEVFRDEMERGETNWEDQSHVVGGIAINVPIIREKFKPRKPSG